MKPLANNPSPTPDAWELLHALPHALLVVTPDLEVVEVNDAAEQLLGTSRKQLCAHALPECLCQLAAHCFEKGTLLTREEVMVPRSGTTALSLQVQACPVFDADHPTPTAIMLLLALPTPSKERSSEAASVMAAMLAHEVKNPLSGIRGAAQLLGKKAEDADKPMADLICREVDRITTLLQKIEFFSNEPALCEEAVNIHEVLEATRVAAQSGFAQGIAIETRYDPSLPPVRGNRDLLMQMAMNLLKNASEALENCPHGRITLSTRYQLNHQLRHADGNPRSLPIAIKIEDNAGGIPNAIREQLFKPFVTTKINGTGLGLAICARIVADHGGTIAISPSAEGGTQLMVRLPAYR